MSTLVALYRTILFACSSRARVVGFAVVGVIEIVVAVILSSNDLDDRLGAAVQLVDKFGLTLIIPLAALVFGTASLGDPIEDGTYVYLWLRPIRRSSITIAAYLATLTMLLPLAVLPTVISGFVLEPSADVVVGALASSVIAALAYAAVFVLMGQVTQRSLIWGVAYLLILEQFISRGGKGLGFISVHSHAVSVLAKWTNERISLDYFSRPVAMVVPLVFTAAWLGWSMLRQRRMSVA
ncbi:MAG: hypothetical protein U0Q22_10290 [Acidimicrobiales bacterium]